MNFVRVSSSPSSSGLFVEGDDSLPFVICGANCYYLMTKHHEGCQESRPLKVLDALKDMGINCVRTWAFADGDMGSCLQPYPFFFDESVFQSLDAIISHCKDLGMRMLLDLTNFWPDYGGMGQYVTWSRKKHGAKGNNTTMSSDPQIKENGHDMLASHFYTDAYCQKVFHKFVRTLIQRKNSITGIKYSEDPTILGFGLANEPRCMLDPGCTKHIIATWAHETAYMIKSIDSNHLVFMDCEGFFGPSTGNWYSNPFDTSSYGTDFAQDVNSPYIDVCCIHMYPEKWNPGNNEDENVEFMEEWIHSHLEVACLLEKPLLLSEFGFLSGPSQKAYYMDIASIVLRHIRSQSNLVGTMFWQACSRDYRYGDEYAIAVDSDRDESRDVIEELCGALHQGYRNLNQFQSRRILMDDERYRYDPKKIKNKIGKVKTLLRSSPESFRRKIDSTSCVLM